MERRLKSLAAITDHACDQCGQSAATIEPSGLSYALLCSKCGTTHGELLSPATKFVEDTVRLFGAPTEPVFIPRAMLTGNAMKRDDLFPSKYLKASDLNGKPAVVQIEDAAVEPLKTLDGKTNEKLVLTLKGYRKAFVLNVTNFDAIAAIHGDETDEWPGKTIELYPTTTSMGGKTMPCIRVRP
jgi:hypothetical protein